MKAYHFVGKTLRDGRPIPANGEWLEETKRLKICRTGLHASKHVADALEYAPGTTLCLVELDGTIIEQDDKVCASRRKIIARFDATFILGCYARFCARSVLHLWEAPDVVIRYLQTGDEISRADAAPAAAAAARAADAAAYAAAAARAAYAASAYAAARAAYAAAAAAAAASCADHALDQSSREKLQAVIDAEFAKLGVQS